MIKKQNIKTFFILYLIVFSCQKEKESNFELKVKVDGLKKGILYLQKKEDTIFTTLDSALVVGEKEVILNTYLDKSELLYLRMDKNDFREHLFPFFAAKGITKVNSDIETFSFESEITGSEQQKLYETYQAMLKRFQNESLTLIKDEFDARKDNDTSALNTILNRNDKLLKQRYAYSINFAILNNNSEISPYITINDIPDTSIKFLDSIYGNLTDRIKSSYYGEQLKELVETRKNEIKEK